MKLRALLALVACTACSSRPPAACDLLSADEISRTLQTGAVTKADGSGFNATTGIDTCRWTADGKPAVELRIYRADSSAEGAWKLVFESARVHAMKPDASGAGRARSLPGVGDDAMVLAGGTSVAFRVGDTGATLTGTASEHALIDLAKRAADALKR